MTKREWIRVFNLCTVVMVAGSLTMAAVIMTVKPDPVEFSVLYVYDMQPDLMNALPVGRITHFYWRGNKTPHPVEVEVVLYDGQTILLPAPHARGLKVGQILLIVYRGTDYRQLQGYMVS